MSFDVFFQGFRDGGARPGGGDLARSVLERFIATEVAGFVELNVDGDVGDVYIDSGGMMANHVQGAKVWELLVQAARAADWVVLPTGGPTCITDQTQRSHLPVELRQAIHLVRSGDDLQRAFG